MDDLQLLAEFEDILRTMPTENDFSDNQEETLPWVGRASAALSQWSNVVWPAKLPLLQQHLLSRRVAFAPVAYRQLKIGIHEAIRNLQYKTGAGLNVAIEQGAVFSYFDSLRNVIEKAKADLFFIDPYLNADFVATYLPFAASAGKVRMLANRYISELRAALPLAATQFKCQVELRSAAALHDRYVLIDGTTCYQSGASFKDGAKSSMTTLTQQTDTFDAVKTYYEDLWASSKIEL